LCIVSVGKVTGLIHSNINAGITTPDVLTVVLAGIDLRYFWNKIHEVLS
jgi:hypothetical protein